MGVSFDSVDVLKEFCNRFKVELPLLSDAGSKTIKSYGLHFQRGLPHPGTILIDQKGVVRARLFEEGYRKRHKPAELIAAAKKLQDKQKAEEKKAEEKKAEEKKAEEKKAEEKKAEEKKAEEKKAEEKKAEKKEAEKK